MVTSNPCPACRVSATGFSGSCWLAHWLASPDHPSLMPDVHRINKHTIQEDTMKQKESGKKPNVRQYCKRIKWSNEWGTEIPGSWGTLMNEPNYGRRAMGVTGWTGLRCRCLPGGWHHPQPSGNHLACSMEQKCKMTDRSIITDLWPCIWPSYFHYNDY